MLISSILDTDVAPCAHEEHPQARPGSSACQTGPWEAVGWLQVTCNSRPCSPVPRSYHEGRRPGKTATREGAGYIFKVNADGTGLVNSVRSPDRKETRCPGWIQMEGASCSGDQTRRRGNAERAVICVVRPDWSDLVSCSSKRPVGRPADPPTRLPGLWTDDLHDDPPHP